MMYIVAALAGFSSALLRGFQQKNVIGHHIKMAACTSYLIALAEVAVITTVVHAGWWSAVAIGTGGALGIVTAMVFHDALFKRG